MSETTRIPPDLSPAEVLAIAIRAEIEAREIYHRMVEKVVNESLQTRLRFLEQEEEIHRKVLEDVFRDKFPEIELVLPERTRIPKIDVAISENSTIEELLEVAMEWEKMSGEFYEELSTKATDHGSKAILISLSASEWGHYHLIKSEFDLVKAFPSYACTKDYNMGEDSLHIGP